MTSNESIITIKQNVESNGLTIEQLVTEWCNAGQVEVRENGDIFIADPMTGHNLDEDSKAEFVAWCEVQ